MHHDTILIELGAVILALGLLGALSLRFSISPSRCISSRGSRSAPAGCCR